MFSSLEKTVLQRFRQYRITPGQILCFSGPVLEKHRGALQQLIDKQLLVEEGFRGAYSLTDAGFAAMKSCDN